MLGSTTLSGHFQEIDGAKATILFCWWFPILSCGAVMLTAVTCCAALCRAGLNCFLLCCPSLHETVTFHAIKELILAATVFLSSFSNKYPLCPFSFEIAPSICCHCCPVCITSLFYLSLFLPLFSLSSIFWVVVMWKKCDMDLIAGGTSNTKATFFSQAAQEIVRYLLAEPSPKCVHSSTLKCLYPGT